MSPNPHDPPPAWDDPVPAQGRRNLLLWLIVGGSAAVVATVVLGFVLLAVAIETGHVPDTDAVPGRRLTSGSLQYLREAGLLEADETPIFFYSAGLLSMESEGCYFTSRRVVSYWKSAGSDEVESETATYGEIRAIEPRLETGCMADSRILVHKDDGGTIELVVSNSGGGDDTFVRLLQSELERSRLELPPAQKR